jgi:glutaminyl-peptide cyclotransferase
MIVWYIMLQAIVRFVFFFIALHYAWSVDDYLYKDTLKGVGKPIPKLERTTPTNGTTTTTSDAAKPAATVITDVMREDNLRAIAQLPGLEKLAVPNGAYLKPFLMPRPVGSDAHKQVQAYIRSTFNSLGWKVEEDRFDDKTPLDVKSFNNIIVTKFPEATRQLVLAAHYDSLYFPPPYDNKFVGATDSSVPCAMLVDIATSLNQRLDSLRGTNRGLQIIFFDGEEAFVSWGPTDSLYGSR